MPNLKMLNSTKYLYKLTFIKCSYERLMPIFSGNVKQNRKRSGTDGGWLSLHEISDIGCPEHEALSFLCDFSMYFPEM